MHVPVIKYVILLYEHFFLLVQAIITHVLYATICYFTFTNVLYRKFNKERFKISDVYEYSNAGHPCLINYIFFRLSLPKNSSVKIVTVMSDCFYLYAGVGGRGERSKMPGRTPGADHKRLSAS